jgi:preprotein translocase subunit YajC
MLSALAIIAAAPVGQPPSFMNTALLFFLPMGVLMYLMIIKPQKRKEADHKELLKKLTAGTRVVTIGGVYGKVNAVKDATVSLEIASRVIIEVNRASIAEIVTDSDTSKDSTKK